MLSNFSAASIHSGKKLLQNSGGYLQVSTCNIIMWMMLYDNKAVSITFDAE